MCMHVCVCVALVCGVCVCMCKRARACTQRPGEIMRCLPLSQTDYSLEANPLPEPVD